MPQAAREHDMCTGHGTCRPRPSVEGSNNVFINGQRAHRVGDGWALHCTYHTSVLATGSGTVYVNGRNAGRVGDVIGCSSLVATGSPDVEIGG